MKKVLGATALASVLVFSLVGCGDDDSVGSDSTDTTAGTVVDTMQTTMQTTMPTNTPTTVAPAPTTSTIEDDGVVRISVTVGVDSGPDRIEEISLGQSVELTIVNPEEDDEFHLHGYDLGGDETPAGEEKIFAFTANDVGDFEVESHVTGDPLVVIRVS